MHGSFRTSLRAMIVVAAVVTTASAFASQDERRFPQNNEERSKIGNPDSTPRKVYSAGGHGQTYFQTDVPAHSVDLVLGRPTKDSITISVLAYQDLEGYVAYGTEKDGFVAETPKQRFEEGLPVEVLLSPLRPNSRYYYRFVSRTTISPDFCFGESNSFHTARLPGDTFSFVVQSDPHLDENLIPGRYERSMRNMRSDNPDFLIDLGDTFMTGKYGDDREAAIKHYLAQRYYFGIVGQSAPVFLVLGNHDGEGTHGRRARDEENTASVWANRTRKKYFPNPIPNDFYSGNAIPHPSAGLLQDYYAWEWGNALFIALDPYWFRSQDLDDKEESWSRSLGRSQYDWLQQTLATSKAPFKFVFIHQLFAGRGGAEASAYYEWGGKNLSGEEGFKTHRPGWPMTIHDLFVKNGVTIVFHGHDHLYAKQERDGIVYQCVPQPGNRGSGFAPTRDIADYGYAGGEILGSPGYMRVRVSADNIRADLVRSYLREEESESLANHQVSHSYEIKALRKASSVSHSNK